jgi:hypothetical protein
MTADHHAKRPWQLLPLSIVLLAVTGCVHFQPGPHSLQAAFEEGAVAYLNGSQPGPKSEQLVLLVQFQNQGALPLLVAAKSEPGKAAPEGLVITARLLNPHGPFPQAALGVDPGLRAGRVIRPFADASQVPLFDRYERTVRRFARDGAHFLKLDPDVVMTNLHAKGNEAFVVVTVPVDWTKVSWGATSVYEDFLELELAFTYMDGDGRRWRFPEVLTHRAKVFLHKNRRFSSYVLPTVHGPATGTFVPVSP